MKYIIAAIATILLFNGQPAQAQNPGSGLCSYQAVTTPLIGSECWPLNQNGVTKTITATQLFKNAVQGPTSSINGDAVIFNGTTGTKLSDAGAPPVLLVADTAALQALPVTVLAVTNKVRVGTYSIANRIYSPPVDYYWTNVACTPDGGSCFPARGGNFWHITPQTVWDPRWWGAYGDIKTLHANVQVTGGVCSAVVTGGTFSSTDTGKLVTITNGSQTVANGLSYQGAIAAGSSGTGLNVSPCPTFTTNSSQHLAWGHDDTLPNGTQSAGPINAMYSYLASNFIGGAEPAAQPQINGGGLSYGAAAGPIVVKANVVSVSLGGTALSSANLPVSTDGVFEISASYASFLHVTIDANYLPVNACYTNANGAIYGDDLRCKNWSGSTTQFSFLGSTVDAAYFTATIQNGTCPSSGAPFTCIMNVTAINSSGLMGVGGSFGGTFSAGSGYTAGDRIILSQTAGAPTFILSVVVNNTSGSGSTGPVSGFQIQEGGAYTGLPTAFTQSSTTHSDGTTGSGTGFGLSGLTASNYAPNTIQPGLGVSGTGVPNGTMIIQNGALGSTAGGGTPGTGGVGTYLVENLTTVPSFTGSGSLAEMSLDIRVPACSPQLYSDPVTPTKPGVGLVSHGNSSIIYDRTFIVGCPNSRTIVLNKAPIQEFAINGLTFYEDSNGFFLGPLAGVQVSGLTVSADDYTPNIADHFGAGLFTDSVGGTSFTNSTVSYGAGTIVIGPDGANNNFRFISTLGASAANTTEWNSPAVLSVDGATNTVLNNHEFGGQVQFFAVTSGIAGTLRFQGSNTQAGITDNTVFGQFAQTEYAPNNTYWFYTEQPNAQTSAVAKGASLKNENPVGNPFELTFTTGGGASQGWAALNPTQIAVLSQQMNTVIGLYGQPYGFSQGVSLLTGPLAQAENPYVNLQASYQFAEQDSNTDFDLTGSANITLTIPLTLAQNSVMSATQSTWHVRLFNRDASGTVSVSAPTGVTLYSAGSSVTSVTLSDLFKYDLDCIRNTTGVLPICFIGKSN